MHLRPTPIGSRNKRAATWEGFEARHGLLGKLEAWLLAGATRHQLTDPLHCERIRNVGIGCAVAYLGFAVQVLEGFRLGRPLISVAGAMSLVLMGVTILFMRSSQRFHLAGHIVLTVVLATVSTNLLVAGGFTNPAIVALFIFPIGAAVLLDLRAAVAWGLLAFAVLGTFWLLAGSSVDLGTVPGGPESVNALINHALVLGGIVVMISVFVRSQKRSEMRVRRAFADLETQATHLELLKEAAIAANEATNLHDAVSECLEKICKLKGWPLAHAYDISASPDEPSSMRSVLHVDDSIDKGARRLVRDAFGLLADASADATNPDLPPMGSRARWDANLIESSNPYRRALAEQLQLSDRVLVLIDIGDRAWMLEFFSQHEIEEDMSFVDMLRNTGTQLGRVLERSRTRSRIHDLSYSDELTGLPNRRQLNESLETLLTADAHQAPDPDAAPQVSLMQIGIDRFKTINDALGHSSGDKLLRKVADRILGVVTAINHSDGGDWHSSDHVFRVGGDEFAVVVDNAKSPAHVAVLAQRILDRLAEPMSVNGREVFTTASIGISISGIDAHEGLALLRCADSALAAAKRSGGGRLRFYASTLNEESSRRLFLENRLRRAVNRDELSLAYQPLISAKSGQIIAAEALLRWTTSDGQHISPAEFIPVAESTGQIGTLGRWVLQVACAKLADWHSNNSGPRRLAVNVSVMQLREGDFVEFVTELIDRYRLPVGALELELTESHLIGSEPEVLARLEQLRDYGASLALDDFGTGYSSLSQLKRLPIEKLKIDRSFVDGIERDTSNLALVEAVVQIGRNLGLTIVAEGVENEEQAKILRANGADELQGYHFSRPVPAKQLEESYAAMPCPASRPTIRGLPPMIGPAASVC